jgi:hypothetical protein
MSHTAEITLDSPGHLVLPEAVIEHLHLIPGMTLVVEKTDPQGAHLKVQGHADMLVEKDGVLVAQGEAIGDVAAVIRSEREQRIAGHF